MRFKLTVVKSNIETDVPTPDKANNADDYRILEMIAKPNFMDLVADLQDRHPEVDLMGLSLFFADVQQRMNSEATFILCRHVAKSLGLKEDIDIDIMMAYSTFLHARARSYSAIASEMMMKVTLADQTGLGGILLSGEEGLMELYDELQAFKARHAAEQAEEAKQSVGKGPAFDVHPEDFANILKN